MIIKVEPLGFAANSYILTADGKNAVIIDPAQPRILEILKERGLVCKYVLLTHGHFDHVGGASALEEDGAEIFCGRDEKNFIFDKRNLSIFGGVDIPRFNISRTFSDGEEFELCGMKFKALFTAGHTQGSVTYVCGNSLFTGDTLFCGGVGRCDLPTGDCRALLKSLKRLKDLDGDYVLYCGHGENGTLDNERKTNPYLRF